MIQSTQHHLWNMVEQCDGMSMASSGTESLMWQRTEAAGRILKCIGILSAQIRRRFIVQMDNDPKYTAKTTQEFLKVKSQSPDLNPIEHAFHLLKTKLKADRPTNKQ